MGLSVARWLFVWQGLHPLLLLGCKFWIFLMSLFQKQYKKQAFYYLFPQWSSNELLQVLIGFRK